MMDERPITEGLELFDTGVQVTAKLLPTSLICIMRRMCHIASPDTNPGCLLYILP